MAGQPDHFKYDLGHADNPQRLRPNIGAVAERARRTSMNDDVMFSEMTGDRNPLHYDEQLAAKSPFGGLIVQGGVTSGPLNSWVSNGVS